MHENAVEDREAKRPCRTSGWRGTRVVCPPFEQRVLALGGELKNTVCYGAETTAVLSEPHGDLASADNYRRFVATAIRIASERAEQDFVVAHDLHPTYLSSQFARRLPQQRIAVQHHHAHAVACAVDAGVDLPVIGVVCDGTGYGTDGSIWGGEVLLCDASGFQRLSHLDHFALPGGDAAARFPWRPAVSVLRETFPDDWTTRVCGLFNDVSKIELAVVMQQLESGLNTPVTSSLGRLFDAVAAILGVCLRNEHEGQAAMALERLAVEAGPHSGPYEGAGGPHSAAYEGATGLHGEAYGVLDWRPMVRGLVDDLEHGVDRAVISRRFHETLAAMFDAAIGRAEDLTGVDRVVLSGGCFLNECLRRDLAGRLARRGLTVAVHRQVSPGDGGLALGQAVIGSAIAARSSASRGAS